MNEKILTKLKEAYEIEEHDIGGDAHLSGKGMKYQLHTYHIKGLGHLCTMKMSAMLGIMKMETAVIAAEEKDVPMMNIDFIEVMGRRTQLVEFYDNQLNPLPEKAQDAYMKIKNSTPELQDYQSGEHWYDSILYPFSYGKVKKGDPAVFDKVCMEYLEEYIRQAKEAPDCDPTAKKARTEAFAQGLLDNGGPAVNTFKKQFGDETTARIVRRHMYGV